MKAFSEKYTKKDLIFVIVMVSLLLWLFWWVAYRLPTTTAFDDLRIKTGVVEGVYLLDTSESVCSRTVVCFEDNSAVAIRDHHSFAIGKKVIIVQHSDGSLRFTMESWW